jgi:hypothetical protein
MTEQTKAYLYSARAYISMAIASTPPGPDVDVMRRVRDQLLNIVEPDTDKEDGE